MHTMSAGVNRPLPETPLSLTGRKASAILAAAIRRMQARFDAANRPRQERRARFMKALYVEPTALRMLATRILTRLSKRAYFSPLAPLREEDVAAAPLPGPRYVRVRNRLAGICGSDIHFIQAEGDLRIAPAALPGISRMYLGHELVGDVVEVGAEVKDYKVGDRVANSRLPGSCLGQGREPLCRHCAVGNYALCDEARQQDPLSVGGGYAEEWVTHEGRLFPVSDDVTDDQAVLLEPAAVGLRAALRRRAQPGDRVMVLGCGTIGLMTLQSIHAVQPQCEITALAQFDYQADMARKLGATNIIMLGSDAYAEVARLTSGQLHRGAFGNRTIMGGFDIVYDCVGRASTLRNALRWTRAEGTVVLVGVELAPMHIDLTPVWYWEIDLVGVLAHGSEDWQGERVSTYDLVVRLIREGKLNLDGFITHRFPLSEYRQAFMTAMSQGRSRVIKVVFDHQGAASRGG
jgi:2-desacetyl-2-hydroxyethyl bacteriochlorophyllide A dehydrogenase